MPEAAAVELTKFTPPLLPRMDLDHDKVVQGLWENEISSRRGVVAS